MKALLGFFLSLKTAFGFFLFFAAVCFYGSLSLSGNLAFFSGIDDTPLFRWLAEAKAFGTTGWIYLFIAALVLFAVNTLICTGEALLLRLGRTNLIARLSPQVMHIGVLFIMLGHLLTASLGVKVDVDLMKGERKHVSDSAVLALDDVAVREDANGYPVDWEASLRWIEKGRDEVPLRLRPVRPLSIGGFGLFSRSVTVDRKGSSALIRLSRDPGAAWALFGGVLLCLGGAGFVYSRTSASSSSLQR
jgi:hypothetical protein